MIVADAGGHEPHPELALGTAAFLDPEVQQLVEEVQAYYVTIYGGRDESPVDAAEFEPPRGLLVLAALDGAGVAMGAWRRRPDLADRYDSAQVAEVKRMFVSPTVRLVLETGTAQPGAVARHRTLHVAPKLQSRR